ncbi:hypothetical protein [Leifsonia sp. 22587]|uniref:hypothetical protein n=1 Tax=Leifsonia sp. 22587 TaxID=3453946 RepID=UPI003F8354A9
MTHRPFSLITAVALAGLAVFLGVLQAVVAGAAPARALAGDGTEPGYRSADGWWIGAYHFDDGALGFCLNPGKVSPTGVTYTYADRPGWAGGRRNSRRCSPTSPARGQAPATA